MKPKKDGKIEKSEDKIWQDWYAKLDKKEHEKMLAQLGLEKEEIEEWDKHKVFEELEEEANGAESAPVKKPAKKK